LGFAHRREADVHLDWFHAGLIREVANKATLKPEDINNQLQHLTADAF